MLNWKRKRSTIANIALVIALVSALGGSAYAAKKYIITSTRQISPSVLKALHGLRGEAGPKGAPGPAGKDGTNGSNGKDGTNGTNGSNGKDGAVGATGPKGASGQEGLTGLTGPIGLTGKIGMTGSTGPQGPLQSGRTETGVWFIFGLVGVLGELRSAALSFALPVTSTVTSEILEKGKTTTNCPGSASTPEALPGFLCLYTEAEAGYLTSGGAAVATIGSGGDALTITTEALVGEPVESIGGWAVTAS